MLTFYERHVVLVAPEVHWNTGNIGRTCLGVGAELHLIKPLGFSLNSKEVKRAGLDYWQKVQLSVWEKFEDFQEQMHPEKEEIALFTKSGDIPHWELRPAKRMFLIFGSETQGLPTTLFYDREGRLVDAHMGALSEATLQEGIDRLKGGS